MSKKKAKKMTTAPASRRGKTSTDLDETTDRPLHSSDTRRGETSKEDLQKASELLNEYAADLAGLSAAMAEAKIEKVSIDGATKLSRGLALLSQYLGNVNRAFSKQKYSPGR